MKRTNTQSNSTSIKPAALITGASSGIGLELAKLFAAEGHPLILTARRETQLKNIADELINQYHVPVIYFPIDLAKPDSANQLFMHIKNHSIAYLVNNAGFGNFGDFFHADLATETELLQLNIVSLTELTKLCLPLLSEHKAAHILQVASTAAFQPGPYLATYYASKAYVLSFSQALAFELQQSQSPIKVTCLCPGPTATEFHIKAHLENSRLFQQHMMSAQAVAQLGYQGMLRGKVVVIPGLRNKMLAWASRCTPSCISTHVAGYLNQKRKRMIK